LEAAMWFCAKLTVACLSLLVALGGCQAPAAASPAASSATGAASQAAAAAPGAAMVLPAGSTSADAAAPPVPPSASLRSNKTITQEEKDAATLSTWAFVNGSVERMSGEVSQLLEVSKDAESMKEDLRTQQDLWHQGKVAIEEENTKLRAEKALLEQEVHKGAEVVHINHALRQNVDTVKASTKKMWEEEAKDEAVWHRDREVLEKQQHALIEQTEALHDDILADNAAAHSVQLLQQKYTWGNYVKIREIRERSRDMARFKNATVLAAANAQLNLKKNVMELQKGVKDLQAQKVPPWIAANQIAELQKLSSAQALDYAQLMGLVSAENQRCGAKRGLAQAALDSENQKNAARRKSAQTQCAKIREEHGEVHKKIAKCNAKK